MCRLPPGRLVCPVTVYNKKNIDPRTRHHYQTRLTLLSCTYRARRACENVLYAFFHICIGVTYTSRFFPIGVREHSFPLATILAHIFRFINNTYVVIITFTESKFGARFLKTSLIRFIKYNLLFTRRSRDRFAIFYHSADNLDILRGQGN